MGVFDAYLKNITKPGPGTDEPVPQRGAKRYWHLLKTHFTKLVAINLLFSASLVPIYLTIATLQHLGNYAYLFLLLLLFMPAIRSGCTRAMMIIARQGNCFVWHEFIKEFKCDFLKRLFVCFIIALLPLIIWFMVGITGNIIGFGSAVGFSMIAFVAFEYLFPMLTITDIPVGRCVKNAFLLIMLEWKKSLLILLFSGVPLVLCSLYLPFTLPLIITVLFCLPWLFESLTVNEILIKRGIIAGGKSGADMDGCEK